MLKRRKFLNLGLGAHVPPGSFRNALFFKDTFFKVLQWPILMDKFIQIRVKLIQLVHTLLKSFLEEQHLRHLKISLVDKQ